ncbi:hypothetical protein ACWGXJ_25565 [Paenibacillus sp. S33]
MDGIARSTGVKVFFLGWQLSRTLSDLNDILFYCEYSLLNMKDADSSLTRWLPLLEKLNMKKSFLAINGTAKNDPLFIKRFILCDIDNSLSILQSLYLSKELASGTLDIQVYNQLHESTLILRNLKEDELDLNFVHIIKTTKQFILASIGIISQNVPYMNIEQIIEVK